MERTPPLVIRLPRQSGRKEQRYAHLFAGVPELSTDEHLPQLELARLKVMAENERIAELEEEVAALRTEMDLLRGLVDELKAQFE
jgi:hypothetical protein